MRLIELLLEGQPLFVAAHDLSQGGLAAALSEMVLRHNIGMITQLDGDLARGLLSETPGRVVVVVDPANAKAITALAAKHAIAVTKIGTTGGSTLTVNDVVIPLDELRVAFMDTIPKLFA
jgi:phosphoribosylformylglycinamidine (FGAM) synthase-like enzyme